MIDDFHYTQSRWNLVVPVRVGPFTSLYKSLDPFNVEVDLRQCTPFGARRKAVPPEDLLHVDLQTNGFLDRPGRLGAGRAGSYRGRYLKGVGRTPLAANWNIVTDQKVATGHLAATAAAREFLVSCYFKAKGKESTVNACEGLLVGPLSDDLRDYTAYGFDDAAGVSPCDASMQAISVKGTRYARFSNFAWSLNNLDLYSSADDLREFFRGFATYLDPLSPSPSPPVTPSRIASLFSSAIERTIENFREFWRLGIYWGAPFNNFTMDGRYHDMDTVLFLGGPFLGVLPEQQIRSLQAGVWNPSQIFGLEVLTYVHYMRIFYRFMVTRLASFLQMELPLSAKERDFIQATVKALQRSIGRDHILFSVSKLSNCLVTWMREDGGLSGRHLKQARTLVETAVRRRLVPRSPASTLEVPLRALPLRCVRPGTFRQYEPPHIVTFCDVPQSAIDEAQFLHDLLRSVDEANEPDLFLSRVAEAARSVARYCTPSHPRVENANTSHETQPRSTPVPSLAEPG